MIELDRNQLTFLVAFEYLVTGHTRDAELATKRCHFLTFKKAGNEFETFIHSTTLFPRHSGLPKMLIV